MSFRKAEPEDVQHMYALIEQARGYLHAQGIDQWQGAYPSVATIEEDVASGNGYVLTHAGEVIGMVVVDFAGEPAYAKIEGAWLTDISQPYAVVHRMCIDNSVKGLGLASVTFEEVEKVCLAAGVHSIKVDTGEENAAMNHILQKNGFTYCGVIQFDGSNKAAYEKVLQG